METQRLFISLPMRGRSDNDILEDMHKIHKAVEAAYGHEFELIDTLSNEPQPETMPYSPTWYLGESVQKLGSANLVALHPDWRSAMGCCVELLTACFYNIPYVELTKDYQPILTTMEYIRKVTPKNIDVTSWSKELRDRIVKQNYQHPMNAYEIYGTFQALDVIDFIGSHN